MRRGAVQGWYFANNGGPRNGLSFNETDTSNIRQQRMGGGRLPGRDTPTAHVFTGD